MSCIVRDSLLGLVCLVATAGLLAANPDEKPAKPRNPFGVPDVAKPDEQPVKELYQLRAPRLTGDEEDANAEQWASKATEGNQDSLAGQWFERWGGPGSWQTSTGLAELKLVGDRIYILANCSNGKFLLDLKRDKDWLTGSYQGIDNPADKGPCVFRIVNNQRLDGYWSGSRWDFRRKLK